MAVTTVKVPVELRDRINACARRNNETAARFLEKLVEREERSRRMEAFGKAFAYRDASYDTEIQAWDSTLRDGLDG
jgi:predicted DNA-binding protein